MPQQCVPGCSAAEARDQPGSRRRPRSMGELRFELGQRSIAVPSHETRQGGATARSRFQQRLAEFSGCIGGAKRGPEPFFHLRNPGEHPGHPGHGDRGAVGSGIESGHVRKSRRAHRQNRFERFPTPSPRSCSTSLERHPSTSSRARNDQPIARIRTFQTQEPVCPQCPETGWLTHRGTGRNGAECWVAHRLLDILETPMGHQRSRDGFSSAWPPVWDATRRRGTPPAARSADRRRWRPAAR